MITVHNLTKSFRQGSVVALDGVSLEVAAGAVCGVLGASGSGKSTLARCLALAERPDRGAIKVDGADLLALDGKALRAARRKIAIVPPGEALLRQRTTAGNIALPLEAAGIPGPQRRSRVAELLDLAGLTDSASTYPDDLSSGQRQRAAVARALAAGPSVLLADEPTTELAPASSEAVLTVLDRARSEFGVAVLITTQDAAVLRRIADDAVVLDGGRVVERGKVLDLLGRPGSRVSAALFPDAPGTGNTRHDIVADVMLVGFAAVGALLPEASSRFDVDVAILGGGMTRLGDVPVAKFRVGLRGERSEAALKWMVDRDAQVRRTPSSVGSVAA